MSQFPTLAQAPLWQLFRDFSTSQLPVGVAEDDRAAWYEEAAVCIAKGGKHGLQYLMDQLPRAEETRARALLTALAFVPGRRLQQPATRAELKQHLLALLRRPEPFIVADAIDALRLLGFSETEAAVRRLQAHASPYVVGSVLRFLSKIDPENARPLLEAALQSPEPLVRLNAVDELDELGSTASLAQVRLLANDPDAAVRQAVRTAVANLQERVQANGSGTR